MRVNEEWAEIGVVGHEDNTLGAQCPSAGCCRTSTTSFHQFTNWVKWVVMLVVGVL